jgi:LEA14-like dessication related protein
MSPIKVLRNVGILSVIAGVTWYAVQQAKFAKKLLYSFHNFKLNQISAERLSLGVDVSIENDTSLTVTIEGFDLDVYINDVFVSKIDSSAVKKIPSRTNIDLPASININPSQFFNDLTGILFGASSLASTKISIRGKVKVEKFGIPFKVPIRFDGNLSKFLPATS